MAGRRHHHLWQLLQRGFSWREHGDDHIWVYEKNSLPYQTVTRKFGRITEFYGPEGSVADANITEFEGRTQSFLQDVRGAANGTVLDAVVVAPIIAHLEMRSRFIREEMFRVSGRVIGSLDAVLKSKENLQSLISNYLKSDPNSVTHFLRRNGVPERDIPVLIDFIDVKMPELLSGSVDDLAPNLKFLFRELVGNLPIIAKQAHIKALEGDFSEVERVTLHSSLIYRVQRFEVGTLLLPDTSVVFFKRSGLTPLVQKSDKIEGTVLPISSEVAIVGSRDGRFQREGTTLQNALASCAFEAFVSNCKNEHFQRLSSKISRNAKMVSESDFQDTLRPTKLLQ